MLKTKKVLITQVDFFFFPALWVAHSLLVVKLSLLYIGRLDDAIVFTDCAQC